MEQQRNRETQKWIGRGRSTHEYMQIITYSYRNIKNIIDKYVSRQINIEEYMGESRNKTTKKPINLMKYT